MKNLKTFEYFSEDIDYNRYYYLVEDIINEEKKTGSVDNPDSRASKALKNKSEESGIPLGILKKVYKRGLAAWNSGHRPGVAQEQWGMGRVNSFITGVGGSRKADTDLWKKVKDKKK